MLKQAYCDSSDDNIMDVMTDEYYIIGTILSILLIHI